MALLKRILLFGLVNIAVVSLLSIITSVFGLAPYLSDAGLNLTSLAIFASLMGFAGAFISLLMSKGSAKKRFKIQLINGTEGDDEAFVYQVVERIAVQNNIGIPEVGIYPSDEINAFATGWNKNEALVAVSQGLLDEMDYDEVEGVVAHEMAHVINGDMVTLTLVQGVVNTFVIFFARVIAYAVQGMISKGHNQNSSAVFYIVSFVLEIVFGFLAQVVVAWFSRWREFGADRGSSEYVGTAKMIKALEFLQGHTAQVDSRHKGYEAMKITYPKSVNALFATHPPLEKRIEALKAGV